MINREKIRAKRIFNLIAPVYFILDKSIKAGFYKAGLELKNNININGKSILDIGTGTGAWGSVLLNLGAGQVHGVDMANKMIKIANKKKLNNFKFSIADAEKLTEFEDNSFDIVTASFVLHGFKKETRIKVLKEMKRVGKETIVLHDYSGKTPLIPKFLEYLERSDYINFKESICDELKTLFNEVIKKQVNIGTAIYISTIKN